MADELDRHFDGRVALDRLLQESGTLADTDDVVEAFRKAIAGGAPAQVVISALWDEEPHFSSPAQARALFANLLGLYDLLAAGQPVDLSRPEKIKVQKAAVPEPFADQPDDAFVLAAWRHLEDHPKVEERLRHTFENRHDGVVSWLEEKGLTDEAFAVARHLLGELFAFLELGGHGVKHVDVATLGQLEGELPASFTAWIDDGLFEAVEDEAAPLSEADAAAARALVQQAALGLWQARDRSSSLSG